MPNASYEWRSPQVVKIFLTNLFLTKMGRIMNTINKTSNGKPVLIIGGGISGLEAALNLAKMDVKVVLVEKSPALGGALPLLFRTYPECACCRIYGKMLEAQNHPNVDVLTLAEVVRVEKKEDGFIAEILRKPRYIDPVKCISCGKCAEVCPQSVNVPGGFFWGERKAAYIPYPQAVPFVYVINGENCLSLKGDKCDECVKACPVDAVTLDATQAREELEVGNIVLASGFDLPEASVLNRYGYQLPNVITSVELERLMSISGPTGGKIVCPGNGNPPKRIAWIQCVGSRDTGRADTGHCSSVCCMFAMKEAINAKELLGDDVETDIYFMDVRAFGKNFEEYANNALARNVNFKYTRIHNVLPSPGTDRLKIVYHNHEGDQVEKSEYDMVVLSTGLRLSEATRSFLEQLGVELDSSTFVKTEHFDPVKTSVPGIYVCGSVSGPKDIYDSMVEAGSVAAEVAAGGLPSKEHGESKTNESEEEGKIGVFICDCPLYELPEDQLQGLTGKIKAAPGVVAVETVSNLCSERGKEYISGVIKEKGINRVVLTSCALTVRKAMFEGFLQREGLKPSRIEVVDLSDHLSPKEGDSRSVNVFSLAGSLSDSIQNLAKPLPLATRKIRVEPSSLVVGGGVNGMEYALSVAEQGYQVYLVEKSDKLGGKAGELFRTWKGEAIKPYVDDLIARVQNHPRIEVYLESEVIKNEGCSGSFTSLVINRKTGETKEIKHGVTHLAVGAKEFRPSGYYCFGENSKVLTLSQLQSRLDGQRDELAKAETVVFIQCVGSRDEERPYCSRVCCTRAILVALELKKIRPKMNVVILHRDIRTYGVKEKLYREALAAGVFFVRYDLSKPPIVSSNEDDLEVKVRDLVVGKDLIFAADMLVLSTAIIPDNDEISRVFSVDLDENGFFAESHEKMKPVQFYNETITMSGSAHAPKFLDESIAQARAAAASAISILRKGYVEVGGIVATVDRGKCAVCCTCVRVCPFDVPKIVGGVSFIDETLCKGCGACVAECPGKAISLVRYEEEALLESCGSCLV